MVKNQLKIKQLQKQILSPLQKLSGELLELPSEALEERIEREKQDNPYLEEETDSTNAWFYSERVNIRNHNSFEDKEQIGLNTAESTTLVEDLIEQLRLSNITEEEYQIGEMLIGNLDEKGYLTRTLSAISDDIYFDSYKEVDTNKINEVLKLLQSFEPAGVGARDSQECLLLQLQRKDSQDKIVNLSKQVIKYHWKLFCKKDYKTLQEKLSCNEEEISKAIKLILSLNLSPGYIDTLVEREQYLIPDVIIWNDNGKIKYRLNKLSDRKLYVSQESKQLLEQLENKKQKDKETIKFLKEKIESAKLFIEAYNNRMLTLSTFVQEIISYQEEYFQEGDVMKLRPMKYEDIKQKTGFSESTISRIANDKYLQTHFGTFSIKKLFTKSIEAQTGEQVSSASIRNIISELINNEDDKSPLTDQEIQNKLQEQGFTLSRRTITKYRQQIGIESTNKRKKK